MKSHTSDFKNQLTELGRELRGVITYGNTTLEEEINSITPHYEADILKSVMKQLDLELTVDIPLNTVINCQIGILVNNSYEMLNYGNYVVYNSEKQEDTGTYKITCYDKLLYSMKQNEDLGIEYPISIKNYLNAVGRKIGLSVANTTFYNQDLQIPSELYLGQEYTYRDILDEIAQATGSIICLNENDEIVVKYPTLTNDTIDEDYLKDINVDFGQKYGVINSIVLSRSGESDNVYLRDEQSVAQNGLTEVKIVDNQIMNFNDRSNYLQGILNALNGLYYYLNDFNSTGILYYEVGDLYNVQIGQNTYQCLMLNDEINVTTGIEEIVHTDMPEKSETDYSKADKTDMKINKTYLIVDKQNQQIDAVVSQTIDTSNPQSIASKTARLTIKVDDIDSKIQDVADITTYGESDRAEVELKDINESEPIMIKVHPTTTNISYLYPRFNLYPSDTQYMSNRIIRFTRTYEEEGETLTQNIDYELPDDLLRHSNTVYDEFYLDYNSQTCQVIKRCEYFGGTGANLFNPDYLINGSSSGISNIIQDYKEKFTVYPNSSTCRINTQHSYSISTSRSYKLSFQSLTNLTSSKIKTKIYYSNSNHELIKTETVIGSSVNISGTGMSNVAYFNLTFEFNDTADLESFGFYVMLNKGSSYLAFEPYNTIVRPLEQEEVIDYPYPTIVLGEGNYTITLPSYDFGYLYARLMAKNIYTTQFYTKVETNSRINQKADEINLGVSQTLTNYSTTNQMNSAITLKANEITSTVSNTYETKNNAQSNYSQLQQTANNISSVVSTKVGEDEIISKINQSSEAVTIDANKINLNGKTINLTGDNIKIASTNFNVDKNGNMTCKNATITGGKINVSGSGTASDLIRVTNSSNSSEKSYIQPVGAGFIGTRGRVDIMAQGTSSDLSFVDVIDSYGSTSIRGSGIRSKYIYSSQTTSNVPNMQIDSSGNFHRSTNTSSQRYKKDIKDIESQQLNPQRLYNLPVRQFKYKKEYQPNEKDCRYNKDLIGFIAEDVAEVYPIATDYNEDGQVENWNERYMIPAMLKLIQEQHTEIEQMKKEIEELKGGK